MDSVQETRQALEDEAGNFYLARTTIMDAADAYGDARELRGHVQACKKLVDTGDGNSYCGEDGVYCDDAPKEHHG